MKNKDNNHNTIKKNSPRVGIIVLNWNNWQDTIECLESIQNLNYSNYQIILIDNGSTDNSLEKIKDWMNNKIQITSKFFNFNPRNTPIQYIEYTKEEAIAGGIHNLEARLYRCPSNRRIIFIKIGENLGFAGGINIGLNYAIKQLFDYIFLLNNDTVIAPDALKLAVTHMEKNFKTGIATLQIRYYNEPERIANSGGYLTITGHRRYYDHNKISMSENKKTKIVTFVTGCAFIARRTIFEKYGLFSDDFFFGEEDYEFSLRMKKYHIKMECLNNAYVYHKVSRSSRKLFPKFELLLIYYLNRFINLKRVYPKGYWKLWRYVVFLYILPMLYIKHRFRPKLLINLAKKIIKYSRKFNSVTDEVIKKIQKERI